MDSETKDKYRVIAELGRGGMATAYLAATQGPGGFNKLLVLKRLRRSLAEQEQFLQMFLEEARLAARINHPNVVQTHEVGFDGKHHYIAMEFLDGQPLHAILRKAQRAARPQSDDEVSDTGATKDLPLRFQLHVLTSVLQGLHHAHELRDFDGTHLHVVHRDVSPHNIMVTYEGVVKVLDFGIAKASDSTHNTRTGVLKGKCAYMPLEQFGTKAIDRRADVFAAGVILWQALVGERLWKDCSDAEIFKRLSSGNIPEPRSRRSGVLPELNALCMKALAREPSARFATAQDFAGALDEVIERHVELQTTPRELGRYLQALFAEERARIRAIVEGELKRKPGSVAPEVIMASPHSATVPGVEPEEAPRIAAPNPPRSTSAVARSPAIASPRSLASSIAIVVLVAAVAALWGIRPPLPSNQARQNAPAASTLTEAHSTQQLRIAARPSHATIWFDGRRLDSNPTILTLQAEGRHEVRIEAGGYRPHAESIVLGPGNTTVAVALQPTEVGRTVGQGAGGRPDLRPRPGAGAQQPDLPREVPPSEPAPSATAMPPSSAMPSASQRRNIDPGDPWKH